MHTHDYMYNYLYAQLYMLNVQYIILYMKLAQKFDVGRQIRQIASDLSKFQSFVLLQNVREQETPKISHRDI